MTRIPWAEWRSGPDWKRGYGGTTSLALIRKEGEVKHSAEGSIAAAFGVLDGPRQASWHFTLPQQAPVRAYQHYELEDICWHCGLPGDERQDTSLIGNITLIGEEHEGLAGEPLTAWQVENTIRLSKDLRALLPAYGNYPPTLRDNLWEHGWLSSTACPSGRIPWQAIIAGINGAEEDGMTPAQEAELAQLRIDLNTMHGQLFPRVGSLETDRNVMSAQIGVVGNALQKHAATPHGDAATDAEIAALDKRLDEIAKAASG